MEEEKSKLETLPSEPRQGSGSMLAAARKQQKRTIEEIAQELNLSVTQIRTIELDQTEGLPEPTYVRGYIRSYAKLLGLKPEEVLHNYLNPDWQKTSSLNDIPRGIGAAEESSPSFFTPTKLVVLLVLAALVTALWYYGALEDLFASNTQTTQNSGSLVGAEEVSPDSASAGDEVAVLAGVSSPVTESEDTGQEATEALENDSSDEASVPPAEANAEQGGDAVLTENVLAIDFLETSWVDIRDAEDQRRAYKSFAQGEKLEVRDAGMLKVFIGNAAGVAVTLNEAPFDIEPHREGVYAKFVIDSTQ